MQPARNLVLVGPMGSGKSSIGRRLADRLGLHFVDADREVEQRTGATVAMIFECEGEAGFRARERATLADLLQGDGKVIATGGGAVLDAGTRALLKARGYVVHLHVGLDRQLERLARDRTRPLLAGDDRAAVLARLAAERAPLYADAAHLRFDTDPCTTAEATAQLYRLLTQRSPELTQAAAMPQAPHCDDPPRDRERHDHAQHGGAAPANAGAADGLIAPLPRPDDAQPAPTTTTPP